ncbi:type II secretion system secretin GspD [Acetobacter estunensis]|uniref:type II secretion system secretin GspD n=1 Tax=Acetobacter estunensis TaxID=104097 RepID=UPI001C2D66AB|nr:type II secretion system secretin GspD [Acetobacter estunensis]MBV1836755.1 type II secretion system secretin GspD [Acetobacter estunensis]
MRHDIPALTSSRARLSLRHILPLAALPALALLSGCADTPPRVPPLPISSRMYNQTATPRVDGDVGSTETTKGGTLSYGHVHAMPGHEPSASTGGDITLNFVDADIQSVTDEVLGRMLKANYLVDSNVHGTITLKTPRPVNQDQLLAIYRTALAGAGAALVVENGVYRVISTTAPGGNDMSGSTVIPLRYTSAESLVKTLQPILKNGSHIVAAPSGNAVVVSGDPATRASLDELVRTFDSDVLAGQSYALFPATSGNANELSQALQSALASKKGQALAERVQVIAMPRIESVMVITAHPQLLEDARRMFAVIEAERRKTIRHWNVFYVQNSRSNDVAYVLQQAFTPNHVTATPTAKMQTSSSNFQNSSSGSSGSSSGLSSSGSSMGFGSSSSDSGLSSQTGQSGQSGTSSGSQTGSGQGGQNDDGISNNPLLGGLGGGSSDSNRAGSEIRIIPDTQNNAVLVYGTANEVETISSMLRKVDIMPLQVRVDATVAEVSLNDALNYGTQFFFKSGGINGILSNASQSLGSANLVSSQLSSSFPGFVLGGSGQGGAPFVINALQSVTKVRVLSSPELMVVDNQPASLMVGDMVPYLTGTTAGVLTSNSTITNSINYQPTGVILQVTPHVSNGGTVTLDITQQVSSVASSTTSTGSGSINSPTFSQRQVTSRVVIGDGQTVGLAGLISDKSNRNNAGMPWLKDIPLLGMLGGTQTNTRDRTELLILITPHVIHSQSEAYALTEDLREQLPHAAVLSHEMNTMPATGQADPQQRLLNTVGLHD